MSLPIVLVIAVLYLLLVVLLLRAVRRKRRRLTAGSRTLNHAGQPTSPPAQDTSSLTYLRRSGLYWGVRLQTQAGIPCCASAQAIEGQPCPLDQALELPLAGCDQKQCHCHYQPLLEKRSEKLRRVHPDRRTILRYEPGKKDRRQLPGRRAKDKPKLR